jgi:hypothetical protein
MKNKDFMIFPTAVRKYVDMHEKSESGYFFDFICKKEEKILNNNAENFHNALIFFENFTNSTIEFYWVFRGTNINYLFAIKSSISQHVSNSYSSSGYEREQKNKSGRKK